MQGFVPAPQKPKGNPKWVKGGPSPNPAGRPRGVLDKRTKVSQALADDAPAIARVVIDAALEGDMQAASLVLSRIAPTLRAQSQPVFFDFDPSAPLAKQMEQVLAAIASGEVPLDVGQQIITAVEALGSLRAVEDLEQRIAQLEESQS
jgi:chemotaxis protein histidine kinase CheA